MFSRPLVGLALLLAVVSSRADDASAWGGLFRSRDNGETWLPVDAGMFIGTAQAIAANPVNANDLLYGTESKLLHSANAGRDWTHAAPNLVFGPVFALAFAPDGRGAVAANGSGVFYRDETGEWRAAQPLVDAVPVATFVYSDGPRRVLLGGARGVLTSSDGGKTWSRFGSGLEGMAVRQLLVPPDATGNIFAIADGSLWQSAADAAAWQRMDSKLPQGRVQALHADPMDGATMWVAAANQVFVSRDAGHNWRAHGRPLPEPDTQVHGIAALDGGRILLVTTHRGLLRSVDSGQTWAQMAGSLPSHLEAGPLMLTKGTPSVVYAGFSLRPYGELWRFASQVADESRASRRRTRMGLSIGAALLVAAIAGLAAVQLRRHRVQRAPASRASL